MFEHRYFVVKKKPAKQYKIRVVDTDFEETVVIRPIAGSSAYDFMTPIIELYARRKLPIAANIARYITWQLSDSRFSERYPGALIEEHIRLVPAFAKHWDEIKKYLLLL